MSKWVDLLATLVRPRERATTLLTLRAALSRQGLLPAERVRLIDLIAELDDGEQLFLAPWVARLAMDPAPAVRLRVFAWFHALSDGETPDPAALDGFFRAGASASAHAALVHLLELLRAAAVDPETPFQALTALRSPVCAMCLLEMLARWAKGGVDTEDRERAVGLTSEVFEEELREQVEAWSVSGPLFLRYLILCWVGEAGVSLSENKSAAVFLWERYAHDPSPIVAVAALEALVRQTRPKDRSDQLDQLYEELRFLGRRAQLHESSVEDIRVLHVGLLGAIGRLALESLPEDTEPLGRFAGLLRQPHSPLLDVVHVTNPETVLQVVHAALGLFGSEVRILADMEPHGYGRYRLLGRSVRLRAPVPGRYLLHATPNRAPPLDWQFHWAAQGVPSADEPHACDLLALTTPAISAGLSQREAIEEAIDQRGWWMLEAFERTAALLRALERLGISNHRDDLLNYLRTLAGAANLARRDLSAPDAIRNRLKGAITSILVSQMATPSVFEHLFPGDGVDDPLDAGLLVSMGLVALRALPQEPGYRWIEANEERLLEVATARYVDFKVFLRSRAWVILKFHAVRLGRTELEGALARVCFPVNEAYASFTLAVWSNPDDGALLERLQRPEPQDGAPGRLGAWAEVLARHLEREAFSQPQAHDWARNCLADEKLQEASQSRRRLLIGYARCRRPIDGPVRRLRDLLLRTASAEELDLYLRLRPELAEDDVRRVVWMRFEQTDRDLVFSGRRLDVQRLTDGLRRAMVLEAEICRRAAGDPTFFRRYLTARGLERGPLRRAGATLFRGRVLGSSQAPEVLVVPEDSSETDAATLTQTAGLTSAFVHPELDAAEVQGIATFDVSAAASIDLHAVPPKRRAGLLRDRLAADRSVLLLARVAELLADGTMEVDLGAALPGLHQRQRLGLGKGTFAEDDPVVVQVSGQVRPCVRFRRIKLRFVEDSPPERRIDLTQIQDLSGWIRDRVAVGGLEGLVLRGWVQEIWRGRERRRCALDLGGLWSEEGRAPECSVEDNRPLRHGQPVWVCIEHMELSECREEVVEASVEAIVESLPPSSLLTGHLVATSVNGHREWEAHLRLGRANAPIVRQGPKLTADLRAFLELLRLSPEIAKKISRRQRLWASDGNAKHVSLWRAPARWTRIDVLAGLFASQVVALTAAGKGTAPGTQRFELRSPPGTLGTGLLEGFGDLADLRLDELVWRKGPALPNALDLGVRVELEARWGHVRPDGTIDTSAPGPYPHLHVARTDDENVALRQRFRANVTLRVAFCDGRWTLQHDEFPWFQDWLPAIEWHGDEPERLDKRVVEVRAFAEWNPFEPWWPLQVKKIQSNGLWFNKGTPLQEVLRFVRIEQGTILPGGPNTSIVQQRNDGRLYAWMRGLRVFLPPEVAYLCPPGTNLTQVMPEECLIQTVESGPREAPVPYDRDDLPSALAALDRLQHVGLIVEVPIVGVRVRVLWLNVGLTTLATAPVDGLRMVGEAWTSVDESWRVEPGQLLWLTGTPQSPLLDRVWRRMTGTFLFRERRLDDLKAQRLNGRLLRRGVGDDPWIFSVVGAEPPQGPPRLLIVPPEQIAKPLDWDEVEPLAGVTLRVQTVADGLRILVRERGTPRPLSGMFQAQRADRSRTFYLRPSGGGQASQDLPSLEYSCYPQDPQEPVLTAGRVQLAFDLSVHEPANEGMVWQLTLRPRFVSLKRPPTTPGPVSRPRLEEIFSEQTTQLIEGRVVRKDGRWTVRLDGYEHDELLLPESEVSWIPGRESVLKEGWKGVLCVWRTEDRFTASLRRITPRTLEKWLKERGLSLGTHGDQRVGYYGLVPGELVESVFHAPPPLRDGEEYVLFEDALGVHVLAGRSQLKHLGDEFDPGALQCGDLIKRFEVLASAEQPEERQLDIIDYLPDLLHDIERFHGERGIFFGRVTVRADGAELTELRGLWDLHRDREVPRDRLGRWQLQLVPPDEEDLAWLRTLTQEQFAYFQFDHADREKGLLFFRVVGRDELFKRQHLLYVRADRVEPYGRSWLLGVRLLDQPGRKEGGGRGALRRHQSRYVITDSLFSARRGRLLTSRRATEGGLFLAFIHSNPSQNATASERDLWVRLSLVGVPARPFRFLFSRRDWQVIVCEDLPTAGTRKPQILVEAIDPDGVSDGVNVKLRLDRIDGLSEAEKESGRPIRPGAVLVLRADRDRRRLTLVDVVPSHLDYLYDSKKRLRSELLLTIPWGGLDYRQRRVGRNDQAIEIIGLPQLEGNTQLTSELAEQEGTIPQVPTGENSLGLIFQPWSYTEASERLAGQLTVAADDRPRFLVPSIAAIPMPWDAVTVLDRPAGALAQFVRGRRWRDQLPVAQEVSRISGRERGGRLSSAAAVPPPGQGIINSITVGHRNGRRVSLTAAFWHPFPVDHLSEQFGGQRDDHQRTLAFPVALADRERLVLEMAPGRYVALPRALIAPLHPGELASARRVAWQRLGRGDLVEVERVVRADGTASGFLDRFRIRRIEVGVSRPFTTDCVVPARWDRGALSLGVPGLLLDVEEPDVEQLDLRIHPAAAHDLRRALKRTRGGVLVLTGTVLSRPELAGDTWLCRVDVGLQAGPQSGPRSPVVRVPSYLPAPQNGDPMGLRIKDLVATETGYQRLDVEAALPDLARRFNQTRGGFQPSDGALREGDCVLVVAGADGRPRVAGFEGMRIHWRSEGDALLTQFGEVFFSQPGAVLMATVEAPPTRVDHRWSVALSRRKQLEQVLPSDDEVGRAAVVGPLGQDGILLHVFGVPCAMSSDEFCYGRSSASLVREIIEDLTREGPIEAEIVRKKDGTLTALGVYQPPPHASNVTAVVEAHAADGVLVRVVGCRGFVERRDLAWCHLPPALLARVFPVGSRLSVHVLREQEGMRFSHVLTPDVRNEIRSLAVGAPVYVVRVADVDEECALVRGRSGILFELFQAKETREEERFSAFVRQIDHFERRVILSPHALVARTWDVPELPADRIIDAMGPEVLAASLDDLMELLEGRLQEVPAWVSAQERLDANPKNLRGILDTIFHSLGPGVPWSAWSGQPVTPHSLGLVWAEVARSLASPAQAELSQPVARFALGWWALRTRQHDQAVRHLEACRKDLGDHVDVELAYAIALHHVDEGKKARGVLHATTTRLWSNAAQTVPLLLLPPAPQGSDTMQQADQFARQLGAGEPGVLEAMTLRVHPRTASHHALAAALWAGWTRMAIQKRAPRFDEQFQELLDRLHEERLNGVKADPRLYLLASRLLLARGELAQAWAHLEEALPFDGVPEGATAAFWGAWLQNEPDAGDGLLRVLERLRRWTSWRESTAGADALIEQMTRLLSRLNYVWKLARPRYRIVPEPPADAEALKEWADRHNARKVLQYIRSEREATAGDVTDEG